jgi:hypothetical protein
VKLEEKLGLALTGFSPDNLGLFVYVLNRGGMCVSEQAVRELLTEGIYDFERRFTTPQKRVLATAVREITRLIGELERPAVRAIYDAIKRVDNRIGTDLGEDVLKKMARYLYLDWDSILKSPETGQPHMLDHIDMYAVDLGSLP